MDDQFDYMDDQMDKLIDLVQREVEQANAFIPVTSLGFGASATVNSGLGFAVLGRDLTPRSSGRPVNRARNSAPRSRRAGSRGT